MKTGSTLLLALWAASAQAQSMPDAGCHVDASHVDGGHACAPDMATVPDLAAAPDMTAVGFQTSAFTSNWGCGIVSPGAPAHNGSSAGRATLAVAAVLVALGLAARRRRRRRVGALATLALVMPLVLGSGLAHAGDAPADLALAVPPDPPPPRRWVAITINPLTYMIDRYGSTNLEIVPASHHALVLTAFYMHTRGTERTNFPVFTGVGGEIGYRYYFGKNGPRGFYLGPSLLLGLYDGTPPRGDTVHFHNIGGALDIGYQAILWRYLVVGLGAGIQYTWASQPIPQQDLPVSIYANSAVRPRLLTAIGATF